jgi:preprotein translocase YajC subunit
MKKLIGTILLTVFFTSATIPAEPTVKIALMKYNGGGDWYANLETSLKNLIVFCNQNLGTTINIEQAIVEVGSPDLFNYPFVHMTGHGNVVFTQQEADNLRKYLMGGGFLHISDNYGMDKFIRPQMKKMKEAKKYQEAIAVGDKVVTVGGIHGKVVEIGDTDIVIALDQGRMRIEKAALSADRKVLEGKTA